MTLASFEQMQARYPEPIDPAQQTWVETLLEDAEALILDTVPDLQDRLDQAVDLTLFNKAVRVQCAMVARVLSNPNGYFTETIDDYTYRRDSTVSTGRLYLDDDEASTLQPGAARRRGRAFSIRPQ